MPTRHRMELGLYDARGHRKYLTTAERAAFLTGPKKRHARCGHCVGCSPRRAVGYPKPCG